MNERALLDQLQALSRKPNHSRPEKEELERVTRKLADLQSAKQLLRNQYGNWIAETPQLLRENSKFRDIVSQLVMENGKQRSHLAKLTDQLTQNDVARNAMPFSYLASMRLKQVAHAADLREVQRRYALEKTAKESLIFTEHRLAADLTILKKNINRLIYFLLKLSSNESKINGSKIIFHFKQIMAQVLLSIHVNKYEKGLGHQFARNLVKRENLEFFKKESSIFEERAATVVIKIVKLEQQNSDLKVEIAELGSLPPASAQPKLSHLGEWDGIRRTIQGILNQAPVPALDMLLRILDHTHWRDLLILQPTRDSIYKSLIHSNPAYQPSTTPLVLCHDPSDIHNSQSINPSKKMLSLDQTGNPNHCKDTLDDSFDDSKHRFNDSKITKKHQTTHNFCRCDHKCAKKPQIFRQPLINQPHRSSSFCFNHPSDTSGSQLEGQLNRTDPSLHKSHIGMVITSAELDSLLPQVLALPLQILEDLILLQFQDISQRLDQSQGLYSLMSTRYFQDLKKLDQEKIKAELNTELLVGSDSQLTARLSSRHQPNTSSDQIQVNSSLEFLIDIRFHLLIFISRLEGYLREINRVCINLSCNELIFVPSGTPQHLDSETQRRTGPLDLAMRFVGTYFRKPESDLSDEHFLSTVKRVVRWLDLRLPFLAFPLTEIDRKNREIVCADVPINDTQAVFRFDFYRCVLTDWPRLSSVLQLLFGRLSGKPPARESIQRSLNQLPSIHVDAVKKNSVLQQPLKRPISKKAFIGGQTPEVT